jgi:hypothetical protein
MGDLVPLPALVGLAAPDPDAQPVRHVAQVLDLERYQLAAAERAREAQRQQCPSRLPASVFGQSRSR